MSAVAWASAAVPTGPAPELAQVGKPDAEEAARILAQFRRAGVSGDFFFEFDFLARPRVGEERVFKGRLWGGGPIQGGAFRVELTDGIGAIRRLLLHRGEQAAVWRLAEGRAVKVEIADSFAPIVPGVEVSAFDLQMPFLHWPGATLEKIARVLGRPAYAYLFRTPPEVLAQHGAVTAARAYLDTQFNALTQTELIGPAGRLVKTFYLVNLKKVGEQYIPTQADYRNEVTRDKTRFQVTGAALNLRLPAGIFTPEGLAETLAPPAAVVRIAP